MKLNLGETIFPPCYTPKFAVGPLLAQNENAAGSLGMLGCIWELFWLRLGIPLKPYICWLTLNVGIATIASYVPKNLELLRILWSFTEDNTYSLYVVFPYREGLP